MSRQPGRQKHSRDSLAIICRNIVKIKDLLINSAGSTVNVDFTPVINELNALEALLTTLTGVDYSTETTLQSVLNAITANGNVLTNLLNENKIDFELASVEDSNGDIFKLVFEKDETTGNVTVSYIDAQGNPATPVGTVNFLNPVSVLTQLLTELQNLNLTDFATEAKQDDIITELQNVLNKPDYEVLQCFGRDSDSLSSWTMVPTSQSTPQIIAGAFTPPLLGIVPTWDSISYSGFNNAYALEIDIDVDFTAVDDINLLADFTYSAGVAINDITVELVEATGNTVVASTTGLVGVPLGTVETFNLIYDNSSTNYPTFKLRLIPNAAPGSYTLLSNNWNYITAVGVTDPAELIIRRVDKYEDNVLQSTEYFDYLDNPYTLVGTFLKDSSLESTSLINSILTNLFNLDVPLSTRASEATLLEVRDYILKTPSRYFIVFSSVPNLDVVADFEFTHYDNLGVLQNYSDGGDLTNNSPYVDISALVNEMNNLSGIPFQFAVPTAKDLEDINYPFAIEVIEGTLTPDLFSSIDQFDLDGETPDEDTLVTFTPCITGFDRIAELLEDLKGQNTAQLTNILTEIQNSNVILESIREQTEFDTENINWQPMCVDGVQWYFADTATFEFGSPSVDDKETIYKQGDDGSYTTIRPTGTTITQGYCSVGEVTSAPNFSGIVFDSSSPNSTVGSGFFATLPNIIGTIVFTLNSGKVLTYTTDGLTARVQNLQDFCDVFNTHVSAFTCNIINGTELVIEEARISPSSITEILITNDDDSETSTYNTFTLTSSELDNLDLIRRDLQDVKNEVQILSKDYSVLRNVATTVTTSVIDFTDVATFGNIDDAVGAIITVKNGTLYSVIQPGVASNNPVTLGVPVTSGATVHIGKTPIYSLQDEEEVIKWKGATDSGTADIIVQFYKYKI
jgi:hypothetical protein